METREAFLIWYVTTKMENITRFQSDTICNVVIDSVLLLPHLLEERVRHQVGREIIRLDGGRYWRSADACGYNGLFQFLTYQIRRWVSIVICGGGVQLTPEFISHRNAVQQYPAINATLTQESL